MPAECQTVQMCLPLTVLALRWHCADFNCLFSWPWWRHREYSDPHDTKFESKIPITLLTPLLRCGLLRTMSTLTFWSTMEVLPFHVRRAMPRSVNACKSSVIVLHIIVGIWMIVNYHRYDCMPMNCEIVGECSPANVATFECGDIFGNRRWWDRKRQRLTLMPAVRENASKSTLVGSPPGACYISEPFEKFKPRGFETSWDLTIRRPIGYWNGALIISNNVIGYDG